MQTLIETMNKLLILQMLLNLNLKQSRAKGLLLYKHQLLNNLCIVSEIQECKNKYLSIKTRSHTVEEI